MSALCVVLMAARHLRRTEPGREPRKARRAGHGHGFYVRRVPECLPTGDAGVRGTIAL